MIKKIKKIICRIFNIKACQCDDEKDPHEAYYLDVPEPEIPVHNPSSVKHCNTHVRFKMSCPQCQDAIRA